MRYAPDQQDRADRADPARRHDQPGGQHRIVELALQHLWRQRHRSVIDQHDQRHDRVRQNEGAVPEQADIEERPPRRRAVDDEHIEAEQHQPRLDHDLGRLQPAFLLAAIERELQRGDGEAEHAEAEPVQLAASGQFRLGNEGQRPQYRQHAERHVDIKAPAPGELIGQIAADDRAQYRADHNAHAENAHGAADFAARIGVEQDRLRQRHQGGAEHALQQAEQHHFRQGGRHAAQHGGDGEAGQREGEQPRPPKLRRDPGRDRRCDGRGDEIGGQNPGDLVLGRAQAPLHVRQRDIGDGGVEHLHDRRADRDNRDHRLVRRAADRACP